MGVIDIRRRLERIEASRHQGAPDRIFSDRPLENGEVPGLLANWRGLVASGRASITGNVLYIISPRLTAKEWAAKVAPLH